MSQDVWTVTVNQLAGFLWKVSPKTGKRIRKTVLSLNSRAHYRERAECMRLDRERIFAAAKNMPLTMPWAKVKLKVTLYGNKKHHSKDWEQTIARLKGYIDGLRDCRAITDDTMENIVSLDVKWVATTEELERTVIEVTQWPTENIIKELENGK